MSSIPAQHLKRIRQICLSFPEAEEGGSPSHPVFCVGKEPFAAAEVHAGTPYLAVRVGPEDFSERSRESRILVKRHVAKEGWVLLKLSSQLAWDEVKDLVLLAYVSVAPRKQLKALERTLTIH